MDQYAKLRTLLQEICRGTDAGQPLLFQAKVKSIQDDCCTIDVSGLELTDVRLKAVANGETEHTYLVLPAVGSKVLVGSLTGDYRDLAVLNIENFDKIILGGKTFGGLVKSSVITEKLNALEQEMNKLKAVFSAWVPVSQDGGGALKTAIEEWSGANLTLTVQEDIENNKIVQG